MRFSVPRHTRGTSVIAAIALAAILGVFALGLNALRSSTENPAALSAAGATGSREPDVTPSAATTPQPTGTKETCEAGKWYAIINNGSQIDSDKIPSCWDSEGNLLDVATSYCYPGKKSVCSQQIQCKKNGVEFYFITDSNVRVNTCTPGVNTGFASGVPGISSGGTPSITPNTVAGGVCDQTSSSYNAAQCAQQQAMSSASAQGNPGNDVCDPNSSSYSATQCAQKQAMSSASAQGNPGTAPNSSSDSSLNCNPDGSNAATCISTLPQQGPCPNGQPVNSAGQCTATFQGPCPNGQTVDPTTGQCSAAGAGCPAGQTGTPGNCTVAPPGEVPPPAGPPNTSGQTQYCLTSVQPLYWVTVPAGQTPPSNSISCSSQPPTSSGQGQQQPKAPTFPSSGSGGGSGSASPSNPNNCNVITSLLGCQQSTISCQLSGNPSTVSQGSPLGLTWTTSGNVVNAQITGVGNVPLPSGSYTVYPQQTTTYTMNVSDQNNNTVSCNLPITVTPKNASAPYGVGTNGQPCSQPPAQPDPSQCTVGTWQPTSATGNGCTTGWQCSGTGATSGAQPTAQLSCQPQVADVGMSVAISYSCGNSTGSTASGFSTNNQTSGSASVTITKPPVGTNTATYGLTCSNGATTAGAQCSVQINQPSIILVANPKTVAAGAASSIGWVTAGMQSCVVSSPQQTDFTAANATNLSVNGIATTSPITQSSEFDLTCTTLGGGTRVASTSVLISGSPAPTGVTVTSSADGTTINHGTTVTINWSDTGAPSGSAMSLWLINLNTEASAGLIAGGQSPSGSYTWDVPNVGDTCDPNSPAPCAGDLTAGGNYSIEASLYSPSNAFLGGSPVPSGAVNPSYTDSGYTPTPFTIGQ